jgi:FkbM family methyltransferase
MELSVKDRAIQGGAMNWVANYLTPRNVGRYLGAAGMGTTIEILWNKRRRSGDLSAMVSDHFVGEGATVVDVGASWGLFTYHFARRVGRRGYVYSYEPHPDNAAVLQKLAKARPHVHFRPVGVSDVAGRGEMHVPSWKNRRVTAQSSLSHGFGGIEGVEVEKISVPIVRLDDELGPEKQVVFVKIDVEGHEMSVLRGGASMLRRCLPTLLIEVEQRHLKVPIEDVFHYIEKLGYHLYSVDEHALRPIAEFDLQRDQLSKLTGDQFRPFSMPKGYISDFCAVQNPDTLDGLPVERRA